MCFCAAAIPQNAAIRIAASTIAYRGKLGLVIGPEISFFGGQESLSHAGFSGASDDKSSEILCRFCGLVNAKKRIRAVPAAFPPSRGQPQSTPALRTRQRF